MHSWRSLGGEWRGLGSGGRRGSGRRPGCRRLPPPRPPAAKAPATAAPAAKAAAAGKDAKKSTQWVKLCDKIKVKTKPEKDAGRPRRRRSARTMFEAIESNTGQLIVSVGLQEIEGAPKQVLAVMVPLGVVIPGGVKLAAYNADQWAKAAKNEKIELKDLKTSDLKFAHCMPVGCTAEAQATPEMLEMLKGNAGLAVLAIWANGNQFTVPVPLTGFAEAHAGKPVDKETYQANRKKLMEQIMQRQAALREKAKADQMKHLPPPPGDTGAAPARLPPRKRPPRSSACSPRRKFEGRPAPRAAFRFSSIVRRSSSDRHAGARHGIHRSTSVEPGGAGSRNSAGMTWTASAERDRDATLVRLQEEGAVAAVLVLAEQLVDLRVAQRLPGLVGQEVLLRHVGDVLGVGVLGEQVIVGLVLVGADLLGDRQPPLLGVVELRIDVEHDAAERVEPVAHDLPHRELGQFDRT